MPRESQKGQKPEPGPLPGTQPIASPSVEDHIRPSDMRHVAMAIKSSACRTVMDVLPHPPSSELTEWSCNGQRPIGDHGYPCKTLQFSLVREIRLNRPSE